MDDDTDAPDGSDPGNDHDPGPVRHEWAAPEMVSTAVVRAVAATVGRPPDDLPPLNRYVDPDALDTLVDTATSRRGTVTVSFEYAGVDVHIDSEDGITVWPAADGGDQTASIGEE